MIIFDLLIILIHYFQSFFKTPLKRCCHDISGNNYLQNIQNNNDLTEEMSASRISLKCGSSIYNSNTPITIDIPIVFHLIDPKLNSSTKQKWKDHINRNIITVLNDDYNRNFNNYATQYLNSVEELFQLANEEKIAHYRNVASTLPNGINVSWNFHLSEVYISPLENMLMTYNNDHIFEQITLVDPESNLNILICNSSSVLGVSTFPFNDRNINDPSTIDPKYKFRNGLVINTNIFLGNTPPYNGYRTFTHEIGHWCGSLHPFDIKSDASFMVYESGDIIDADLHPQKKPTYGTVFDRFKKGWFGKEVRDTPYAYIFESGSEKPNFYNFMDYTDDHQMCMFTHGQIMKMLISMARFRPNFVNC